MNLRELAKGLEELYGFGKVAFHERWIWVDVSDAVDVVILPYKNTFYGHRVFVKVGPRGRNATQVCIIPATLESVSKKLHEIKVKADSQRLCDLERLTAELSSDTGG